MLSLVRNDKIILFRLTAFVLKELGVFDKFTSDGIIEI
jgi:hypothetical protein